MGHGRDKSHFVPPGKGGTGRDIPLRGCPSRAAPLPSISGQGQGHWNYPPVPDTPDAAIRISPSRISTRPSLRRSARARANAFRVASGVGEDATPRRLHSSRQTASGSTGAPSAAFQSAGGGVPCSAIQSHRMRNASAACGGRRAAPGRAARADASTASAAVCTSPSSSSPMRRPMCQRRRRIASARRSKTTSRVLAARRPVLGAWLRVDHASGGLSVDAASRTVR